jgi:polyhydroxyalkanoate synthesis regulator phasin
MAEETKTATATTAAPKRKPVTKRKPVAAKRKPVTKRKPAAKRSSKKSTSDFAARAQEAGRNAFLASLGFYGKAFDQAQDQFNSMQDQLEERRKKADKLYKELVKRGKKVEKKAKGRFDDLELNSLTDRKKLEKRLDKAKARFEELKETVGFKAAA